ncbi:MAG: ribbon-helix-helix protein, CopG family [Candidatus Melainabacteria bacterium]|nr:ribbon-helix-helix protein, CopG family [Candidatus Melainabacteria bacterium]
MTKVLVNFQNEFLEEVDKIAELEHRTRSSLIREALRRYLAQHKNETIKKESKESEEGSKPLISSVV